MSDQEMENTKGDILLYQTEDGRVKLDVRLQDETVWLTQSMMAELFQTTQQNISQHTQNIYAERELVQEATHKKYLSVRSEGEREVKRLLDYYNLDMIISVGYRVKSAVATRFRIWATQRLNEFIVKGFTMDDERLKEAGNSRYFEELLARIRDIRSAEKVFWRKILDIYATSIDYDPKSEQSRRFFRQIQNKMHWATHGQTATELIYRRADADQPNMGITNYPGNKPLKRDVEIAKNYLNEDELNILNRIVTAYLEVAVLQHIAEFGESHIAADRYLQSRGGLFGQAQGLDRVDVLEITKLADKEGPNTIATRSLGDQNLLLVDEGHRGLSGKDVKKNENAWYKNRAMLCEKGFTFEYSATFEQSVGGTGHEDDYAKAVLFDYSYRWFYEDGFGKDYQILNLPESFAETRATYLTACLLKYYQQLRIYEEAGPFESFNLEKPLWVFVGSTVSKAKGTKEEKAVATDVAQIIQSIADFLDNRQTACRRMHEILTGNGQATGLLDSDGNDIFAGAFIYLAKQMNSGETVETLYRDILGRLFNSPAGGHLALERIKGESGEVALKCGAAETPFGLINVGDAKGLCEHVAEVAVQNDTRLTVGESAFSEAMFSSVKDSSSPVNLLIGSKKFVEGWDCWRVSTMGLMHVGRSEGAQIIQLFGRGVRLKGYQWSLKRSGHAHASVRPSFIEELETLNVFGVEADFMEKFRDFLKEEGLPGNERRKVITVPLNVTYDFGKKLKILRPKRKSADGQEYDFKQDAPVPSVGDVPEYLTHNPVVADWYPRIQSVQSRGVVQATKKDEVFLREQQLALLDYDALFFELEQFKRERSWHNCNISKAGIRRLLARNDWYTLYLPETRLNPASFDGVRLLQQVAAELLKRYCDHYYNFCKREYIEPRLELRELTATDDNIPQEDSYQLIVDGSEEQVIQGIEQIKKDLVLRKDDLLRAGDLQACNFGQHLYQPLFHVRRGGEISVLPVALNQSEYQFVTDLKTWRDKSGSDLKKNGTELFLLRNMSRGKGVGFFEAGNFHPDFILWMLKDKKQYVTFIEPHGLLHEGPGSEKVMFHQRIKDIEKRLDDPAVVLNSFILSWTRFSQLDWGQSRNELEKMHVLFMHDDRDQYIGKLFG